jgi:hypothetical protein
MRAELLTKEQLGELICKYAEEIAYNTLENPFEFKDIYNCYVVPMVVLQNE